MKIHINYILNPYGDTLKSAMVGNYDSDLNAFGELASHEMPYSQMGYRVYSEDFGRFLSPDPLFEQFDSWTPYHFGFNNPVMYSDPSGLAPKKEKREARLLFSPAVEEREKLLKMIEEAERIFLWAQAYHNSFMMESNISYNRWQDGLHGGGGGSGNYDPGKIDLVALKKEYEETKAEREKINQEKGIIEGKERGTGKGDIPYPYSNEFVDNYNDGLKTYTTQEVMVYGERPKTSFNDDLMQGLDAAWDFTWDMMKTSENVDGVNLGYPPGVGLVKGAFSGIGKSFKYAWFNNKYIGIESKLLSKMARKGGRGAEHAGLLNRNNYLRIGWGWDDISKSYVFRFGFGKRLEHIDIIKIPYRP